MKLSENCLRWLTSTLRSLHRTKLLLLSGVLIALCGLITVQPVQAIGFTAIGNMGTERDGFAATLLPTGKVLIMGGRTATGYLNSAVLYDPATGKVTATSDMETARAGLTATLLPNGKVLIAGGRSAATEYVRSAELYDPATGVFSNTGEMSAARAGHTATLLPGGKVLIAGGGNGSYLNSAELYDSSTGTFTAVGSMGAERSQHTATLLPGGKVLIAGGETTAGYLNGTELYDPATGLFTAAGSMTVERYGHSATLLATGKVLVAGGGSTAGYLSSTEIYDPATGLFTASGSLGTARFRHSATLLTTGQVLLAGGMSASATYLKTAMLYNTTTGTVSSAGNMITARAGQTATLLPSGMVFLAGGVGANGAILNSTELYDRTSGTCASTGTLVTARESHTTTLLPNGKMLIVGGWNDVDGVLNSAELYDPVTGVYTVTGSLATPRANHTATLLPNGKVLIAAGFDDNSGDLDSTELYNPATGTFSGSGSLIQGRQSHTATLLRNGTVLMAGGTYDGALLGSAEFYDPSNGEFTDTGSMGKTRYLHTATLLPNGKVLIAGGRSFNYEILGSAELYDPAAGVFTATGSLGTARDNHAAQLLPSGKVLISGGKDSLYQTLAGAELYDATAGTFSPTGSMVAGRSSHRLTLLQHGRVLVTGGENSYATLASAELYEPVTGSFSATGSMIASRESHTTTLLPTGKVLIAGGWNDTAGGLRNSELYNPGLGFSEAWRPVVSSLVQTTRLTYSGSGFTGLSEGSGGTANNSATNFPLLHLHRVDNDQVSFLSADPNSFWSATSFISASLKGLAGGTYRATLLANAIPSRSQTVVVAPAAVVTPTSYDFDFIAPGTVSVPASFTITNNGIADLIISDITAGSGFTVDAGSCGALPATLAPESYCDITVVFSPIGAVSHNINLVISTNDPLKPVTTIPLSGTGGIPTYLLTVNLSGTGAGSGNVSGTTTGVPETVSFPASGSVSVSKGAVVTLTAAAGTGSAFTAWSGACTGSTTCTVTMDAAKTVTAGFAVVPLPTITSFSPTYGKTGVTVTINGTNLGSASSVKINETAATILTNTATRITTAVPVGATSGRISVTTAGGTATSAGTFSVAPAVASFTPATGPVGSTVIITGTNLATVTLVKFNTTAATGYSIDSATQITATVPAGATTGKISVTSSAGTGSSAGSFTVVLPPSITIFTPATGLMGATVVISGTNLATTNSVTFNGIPASIASKGASSVTVKVPAGNVNGPITVTTAAGQASSAGSFTVPAPTITSFTPVTGGIGTGVTITGTNFTGTTSVKFKGIEVPFVEAPFIVATANSIATSVPLGAATGPITVTTYGGSVDSSTSFTVGATPVLPRVSSFTPVTGGLGTAVTISGGNFVGAKSVLFNNTPVSTFTVLSNSSIVTAVPPGASNGRISVTGIGTGISTASFTVDGPTAVPSITSFTPASGKVGSDITVTGGNLGGVTKAFVGGDSKIPAPFRVRSATSLIITVPAGAPTGALSVTTDGGTGVSGSPFTVTP